VARRRSKGSFKISANGHEYTVIMWVKLIDAPTRGNPRGLAEDRVMYLETDEGYPVIGLKDLPGMYHIQTPTEEITGTSEDPNRPH
jgi:hypothetical protein